MNKDKSELVTMIKFLVDNICGQVGNKIFRQGRGILMGTDCASLWATLYIFHMHSLLKNTFPMARMFTNTVRYIDDLLTLHNPSYATEIVNIYPPEWKALKCKPSTRPVDYCFYVCLVFCLWLRRLRDKWSMNSETCWHAVIHNEHILDHQNTHY